MSDTRRIAVGPQVAADAANVTRGVVVVSVTYNSGSDVAGFVASVPDRAAGRPVRLVVADNASTDGTVAALRRLERPVEVVELGANLGYAGGINAAVARAGQADAYLIANPDVRLEPGCLEAMLAAAGQPGVGIVVPQLRDPAGGLQPSLRREPGIGRAVAEAVLGGSRAARLGVGELVTAPGAYRQPSDVEWATGALLLVTRDCMQRVGPWDASYFLYSEETDFMLRARDAGFRVRYTPTAGATHRGGAAHSDPYLWSLLTVNRVRLFARRHSRAATWMFWAAVLLNEVLRAPRSVPHRHAARDLIRASRLIVDPRGD